MSFMYLFHAAPLFFFRVVNCQHVDKMSAHATIDLRSPLLINPRPRHVGQGLSVHMTASNLSCGSVV